METSRWYSLKTMTLSVAIHNDNTLVFHKADNLVLDKDNYLDVPRCP
jgi:hypothetical protein